MSAKVKVILPQALAPYCEGETVFEIEGDTLLGALQEIVERFPLLALKLMDSGTQTLLGWFNVYLNDQIVRLTSGEDRLLKDGDEIVVLSAFSGG